jgi:hypothetical protein
MAHEVDTKDIVEFKELLIDVMYQLLIQKRYFTEAEFLVKLKEVQMDYKRD